MRSQDSNNDIVPCNILLDPLQITNLILCQNVVNNLAEFLSFNKGLKGRLEVLYLLEHYYARKCITLCFRYINKEIY